jgi:hypothetical protein
MTDQSAQRGSSDQNNDNIEDAVVVDDTATASGDSTVEAKVEPVPDFTSAGEPEIVAEATETASSSGEPRVVYLTTPAPPKVAGNRGFGVFIALLATLIFAFVFAIAVALISAVQSGRVSIGFVQAPSFYVPIAFFAVGAVLIALIVNRAGWPAHVVGSIIVGLIVYFGTIGVLLLSNGIIENTPEQAQFFFSVALADPGIIAGGLLAREVWLWTGAMVAKRGRKVTTRNRDARAQWEAELAETTAGQH